MPTASKKLKNGLRIRNTKTDLKKKQKKNS